MAQEAELLDGGGLMDEPALWAVEVSFILQQVDPRVSMQDSVDVLMDRIHADPNLLDAAVSASIGGRRVDIEMTVSADSEAEAAEIADGVLAEVFDRQIPASRHVELVTT